MIVGNGLIAKALQKIDAPEMVFFASGVSNSLETNKTAFEREVNLLKKTIEENDGKKLMYFSTLSIEDQSKQDSAYVLHKIEIENYIKNHCKNYLVLRIGNIVGNGGNENTLFNFLKNKIKGSENFNLHTKARRLLVDMEDITKFLAEHSTVLNHQILNFAYPNYYNLKEMIVCIEEKLSKKAQFEEINEGDFYKIEFCNTVNSYFSNISADAYLKKLVEKYI